MKKVFRFLYLAFSENGVPSSKRLMGGVGLVAVLFCSVYICMTTPFNNLIKAMIDTEFISLCGLLGLPTIMNALNKGGKK